MVVIVRTWWERNSKGRKGPYVHVLVCVYTFSNHRAKDRKSVV